MNTSPLFRHGLVVPVLAAAALAACADAAPEAPEVTTAALSPHPTYIVVLNDGDDVSDEVAAGVGAQPELRYRHALKGFSARLPPAAVAALARHPRVRFVEEDREVHASYSTGVDRFETDLNPTITAPVNVDVAVLDTGVDHTHPALDVVRRVNCARGSASNATCRENDGTDMVGHGTHVAGTIGATSGEGVAPGARIWSVRVLGNNGSGYTSWIIAGIDYVTAHASEIEVANMSLGGLGSDDTDGGDCRLSRDAEHLAVCNAVAAGVVFVAAAGNEGDDAKNHTPAAFDEVITVSALADFDGAPGGVRQGSLAFRDCTEAEDDSLACFSNFGRDVDLMAPGVNIRSTAPGGGFQNMSGTSMAAPHVAGLAALYVSRLPSKPASASAVAAVRAAMVAAAVPQASACGLTTFDDPDGIAEPLALASAPLYGGPGGCEAGGCESDADCDDANVCNGAETCGAVDCQAGTALVCNDGNACTSDACNASTGCVFTAIAGCGQCRAFREACTSHSQCCSGTCFKNKCK